MAYRFDDDLEFLKNVKSEDLNDLVYVLTHDTDGQKRFTEELTMSNSYKRYNPDHHQYWEEIAGELQCFGANTAMSLLRGRKGVLYKEVLTDVCDKLKVNYSKNFSVEKIEDNLFMKIIEDSVEKMSSEEIAELGGIANMSVATPQSLVAAFQTAFRLGGFKSYQITLIVANAIMKALFGRGLSLTANAMLTRGMAIFTGPIGWIITGLWAILDIAGPAFRVTIPAVVLVACLRKKMLYGDEEQE